MAISVIDPVGSAIHRTLAILFRPFDLGKWFVLGFCAWLACLGEGGGGGGGNFSNIGSGGGPRGGGGPDFQEVFNGARDWVLANFALVIAGVCAVALLTVIVLVLVTWLSSRGKFMFLDGVVRNRAAVVEPWRRFRSVANSLFWFRFILGLMVLCMLALIFLAGLAIAWQDIVGAHFGVRAIVGLVTGVLLILPFVLVVWVIELLLEDFVVPIMYMRGTMTMASWGILRRELLPGRVGPVILFYLMKIVLGLAIGLIGVIVLCVACCVTCCLAALPYLSTVVLLPLFVFSRSYSLCFLQQFGPEWRFFAESVPPAAAPPAVAP